MSLTFSNASSKTLWAMVEWSYPNCPDGGEWMKKGWWQIEPGGTAVVYGGDVHAVNPIWYCYAYALDGSEWRDSYQELARAHLPALTDTSGGTTHAGSR